MNSLNQTLRSLTPGQRKALGVIARGNVTKSIMPLSGRVRFEWWREECSTLAVRALVEQNYAVADGTSVMSLNPVTLTSTGEELLAALRAQVDGLK
ncbi:hypothetical protein [Lysinibacter cavernae]|uniref:hypothetical protein n=1 Tax=Lysinibacter cavernae TaxID=1640652 RepID=UPI00360824B8